MLPLFAYHALNCTKSHLQPAPITSLFSSNVEENLLIELQKWSNLRNACQNAECSGVPVCQVTEHVLQIAVWIGIVLFCAKTNQPIFVDMCFHGMKRRHEDIAVQDRQRQ